MGGNRNGKKEQEASPALPSLKRRRRAFAGGRAGHEETEKQGWRLNVNKLADRLYWAEPTV